MCYNRDLVKEMLFFLKKTLESPLQLYKQLHFLVIWLLYLWANKRTSLSISGEIWSIPLSDLVLISRLASTQHYYWSQSYLQPHHREWLLRRINEWFKRVVQNNSDPLPFGLKLKHVKLGSLLYGQCQGRPLNFGMRNLIFVVQFYVLWSWLSVMSWLNVFAS